MSKHLSFWIGFFAASLLIVPVAVGVWGVATDLAVQWGFFIFGLIAGLIAILIVAVFIRGPILRTLFGRAEASLEDVSGGIARLSAALAAGDRRAIETEADALARTSTGWWAWSNFYRWVISTAIALLLAFGAFTGSILLFEQTRIIGEQSLTLASQTSAIEEQTLRLNEQTNFMEAQTKLMEAQTQRLAEQSEAARLQNEILTLDLVGRLRSQLLQSVESRTIQEWAQISNAVAAGTFVQHKGETQTCSISLDPKYELRSPPAGPTISAISALAQDTLLRGRIITALEFLVQDRDPAVSFGAVWALDQLGINTEAPISPFSRLILPEFIEFVTISQQIEFSQSIVASTFHCSTCALHADRSYVGIRSSVKASSEDAVIYIAGPPSMGNLRSSLVSFPSMFDFANEASPVTPLSMETPGEVLLTGRSNVSPCQRLQRLSGEIGFVTYEEGG